MKTVAEIEEWMAGVAAHFGDPSARTCQIFAQMVKHPVRSGFHLLANWDDQNYLMLNFGSDEWLPLPVDVDGPSAYEDGSIEAYGLKKVCDGVWSITPSLNMPGLIHAFVTIYDVPKPAPWESVIVVVGSMAAVSGRRF